MSMGPKRPGRRGGAGLAWVALAVCAAGASGAGPAVRIDVRPPPPPPAGHVAVPWVAPDGPPWPEGAPTFELADEQRGTTACGWVAVTNEHILLHVVVADDIHRNDEEPADIWKGDSLQIGVDALGNGLGPAGAGEPMLGADDASVAVALTERGPEVWAHFQGSRSNDRLTDGARSYPFCAGRDDAAGTTTYDLALPWDELGAEAGVSPVVGLAVQVNDSDPGHDQASLQWGGAAGGRPRPELFVPVAPGPPPAEHAAALVLSQELWREDDTGEVVVALASRRTLTVRARVADQEAQFATEAGADELVVSATPGTLPEEPLPLTVEVLADDGSVLAAAQAELLYPGVTVDRLHRRVEQLLLGGQDPLFARHLRSVDALVQAEWTRARLGLPEHLGRAREAVRLAGQVLAGLEGPAAEWAQYARGDRNLVLAFVSEYDGTLQYYLAALPPGFDADRSYPLVVSLHGPTDPNPLSYFAWQFAQGGPVAGDQDPQPADRDFLLLKPWGRGNTGFRGAGETDVWEALADARRTFRIDRDRTYLTGFSIGGRAAWEIALRTPDRWAAVCCCAPPAGHTSLGAGLGRNAAQLPVRLWHGQDDVQAPPAASQAMACELRRYGNESDVVVAAGVGHAYPEEHRVANARWLRRHTRVRPNDFSFVADTPEHTGVWGVCMACDPVLSRAPRLDCRVRGNTVHVSSVGAASLEVDLGMDGLGLSGEAVVYWNGRLAYEGPVAEVALQSGHPGRR
jgi:poly(3-hydroxybutyrate) depolymerase